MTAYLFKIQIMRPNLCIKGGFGEIFDLAPVVRILASLERQYVN